ncbi:hypothetical protein ACKS0A_10955 [Histoplasma ohiense]
MVKSRSLEQTRSPTTHTAFHGGLTLYSPSLMSSSSFSCSSLSLSDSSVGDISISESNSKTDPESVSLSVSNFWDISGRDIVFSSGIPGCSCLCFSFSVPFASLEVVDISISLFSLSLAFSESGWDSIFSSSSLSGSSPFCTSFPFASSVDNFRSSPFILLSSSALTSSPWFGTSEDSISLSLFSVALPSSFPFASPVRGVRPSFLLFSRFTALGVSVTSSSPSRLLPSVRSASPSTTCPTFFPPSFSFLSFLACSLASLCSVARAALFAFLFSLAAIFLSLFHLFFN